MSIFDKVDVYFNRLGEWMDDSISRWIVVFTVGTVLLFAAIWVSVSLLVDEYELTCPPGSTVQVTESTAGRGTTRVYSCVQEVLR